MLITPITRNAARGARSRWLWSGADLAAQAPTGVEALVASGATPAAGGPLGAALDLEAGTTNLVANPSFETNTAGWTQAGSGTVTLTRTASAAMFGGYVMRIALANDANN